ncbi:MAG: hypothetical protein GTO63_02360 [Anaerolineae bacterium]|nr:hypothetical protein [Anaerolineae bacterium]NIN93899.1 hypothetical protein [Anaerolineae bacterium]NIQ76932.1 hypothetical protein [Anaerolineae bacterium]
MARCPHLGLEDYRTNPFPFPSPSHRCYVSEVGIYVGQQEQQTYCLTKRHTQCSLFVSHPVAEAGADLSLDGIPGVATQEAIVTAPPKKRTEPLLAPETPATRTIPGPQVELKPEEIAPPSPHHEVPATEITAAEPTGGLEPETIPEPMPMTVSKTLRPASTRVFAVLPWAAVGVAGLMLLCVGGIAAQPLADVIVDHGLYALRVSSFWPGALLVLSAASFGGAILLSGLFLWTRRSTAK